MPSHPVSEVIRHLRRAALRREGADPTDGELLGLFLERRDEAALAALVRRHGPMVWGVCRRVLPNHHDAEDAFQATFHVLVRKAASVTPRGMVANWLYGVARQTALKARATAARRRGRESQVTEMPEPAVADEQDPWDDLQPLLDRELNGLPDKYRATIVLCDLEGKTRKEAARQLGLPEGTVGSRLARARALLARRLARHGVTASGGALAAVLAGRAASAAPPSVVSGTIKAASLLACGGGTAAGAVSARVAVLTEGVVKAMLLTKLRAAAMLLVAVGVIGLGSGLLGHRLLAARAAGPAVADASKATPPREDAGGTARSNEDGPAPPNSPAAQEARRLAGAWAVRHVETNGEALLDQDGLKEARITFAGDRARVTGLQVLFVRDFSLKLYPDQKPKAIDVTFLAGPRKGDTFQGVYVIRGDEVRICLRLEHPEHGRPKGFVTNSGRTLYTFILGRAGARKPPPGQDHAEAAPAQACRVTGSLVSTEYARAGGSLERAVVSVRALPGRRQVAHSDGGGAAFAFDLAPGEYLLECTGVGSRGATFAPTEKKFTVRPGDTKVEVGEIDLPSGEITRLFGRPAPELAGVAEWKNTDPLTLKGLRGKVVVLDFWGHHCSICLHHKPDLARLADRYKGERLAVLTVHDNSVDTIEEAYQKLPESARRKVGSLPVALDGKGAGGVFRSYGVRAVPTVVLIDQGGTVVRRFHHAGDPELEREVARLLDTKVRPVK